MKTKLILAALLVCGMSTLAQTNGTIEGPLMTNCIMRGTSIEIEAGPNRITRIPVTNWTGVMFQKLELGYVSTNIALHVEFEDSTNDFTLKSIPSGIAVWRTNQSDVMNITNIYFPRPENILWLTNRQVNVPKYWPN